MTTTERPDLTLASLTEITKDPIDAMRLAADLYALNAYRAERVLVERAGLRDAGAPKPISKYLRAFMKELRLKLKAVMAMLDAEELGRLMRLGPAISRWIGTADAAVSEEFFQVVAMPPEQATQWIREHLDEIEARFAS